MNKKIKSKGGVSGKTIAGVGAGIAVLTAAAYILFGPDGKKNRKLIRGWAVKMKGEIIEKFEAAKELTEPVYHQIVDTIKAKYAKLKNVNPKELDQVVSEIKKHWNVLKKEKTTDQKSKAKK